MMNDKPSSQINQFDSIQNFVAGGVSGTLTSEQWGEFERLLLEDDDACRMYAKYVYMSTILPSALAAIPDEDDSLFDVFLPAQCRDAAATPIFEIFGSTLHGTVNYFSSGWPLAYLITPVIFAIGLLVGYFTPTSTPSVPTQIVVQQESRQNPSNANPGKTVGETGENEIKPKKETAVGCIVDLVDCKFSLQRAVAENHKPEIGNQKYVFALNDKLILDSGLMEIAYDTGANVILQGPCTYTVESASGGFLAVGKLTATLEKPVASAKLQTASNPQSPSLPVSQSPGLFFVRTPTAIVTDLGTEFGVEVSKSGASEVHVMRGLVEAKFIDAGGKVIQSVELKQGEARQYDRAIGRVAVISANRKKFSQLQIVHSEDHRHERWLAYSQQLREDPTLVAYYPFESKNDDPSILPNASSSGSVLNGKIEGARWANGRLPGKAALRFDGASGYVALPQQERFNFKKAFSVAVWFKLDGSTGLAGHTLIAKGDIGWRILQRSEQSEELLGITFDTDTGVAGKNFKFYPTFGRAVLDESHWHHAVAVYQEDSNIHVGHKYLYIDGQLDVHGDVSLPLTQSDEPVWIGNNSKLHGLPLSGLVDEVAVFSRSLSAEEVVAMFTAGAPTVWSQDSVKPATGESQKKRKKESSKSTIVGSEQIPRVPLNARTM